ncbi:MAG: putative rane protein insertion efficiency factor [Frankiaceae bacterium]|nr:putative rane protein insertion efficiency factor [Frankiaceae bacterium]
MQPRQQPRRLSSVFLRGIRRYRKSPIAHGDRCRFTPSCSYYAEELLRTRALPVALVLIAGRVLRCNPLAHQRVADPVGRGRRRGLRPNAVPTFLSVLALSSFVVVVTAGVAGAVGVTNGCTATINGRDPATLDKDHALVVHKGESVSVTGTVPPSVAGLPKDQLTSNTHIDVSLIQGVFDVSSSDHPGHGPNWGGTQNVDDYLKYGVGLYHVTGVATGSPGWSCDGDGYIELKDGNPLGKPAGAGAAAFAVIGGAGALLSARGKPDDDASLPASEEADAGPEAQKEWAEGERLALRPAPGEEGLAGFGCLIMVLVACFLAAGMSTAGLFAIATSAPGGSAKRRIWAHGHPIAGFIFGLIGGLGITVLLQQYAVWPLTIVTAIALPVVVGLLCAVRAYLGRPYKR